MGSVVCGRCLTDLGPVEKRKAFISLLVYGDEETRSWYFCGNCRVWMIEYYTDVFMGEERVSVGGPYPEKACEADVALALTCPDPGDKWCECEAHRKLGPG